MTQPMASTPPPNLDPTPPEANYSSAAPESQSRHTAQPETLPRHIQDAVQGSEPSPRAEKDVASEYWTSYERIANQHDDELIDRHNRDLDALLIFAGLFSSVSSAFIVNMESSLSPQPSDTTNALLKVLINMVNNGTFSDQEATLPAWKGPSSMVIWIQSLVYTSLSMSLLAAFGGVLGKQWLGHFKTSRFGHGALHERCTRRQRKLDGLKTWHFNTIIAALPILLQLSLLFFGIALAANIWTLQHTVASVIMGATSFGVIFYFFTVVASLKSPHCPFQTPVSTILNRVLHASRETMAVWARRPRRQSWASFLTDLREFLRAIFKFGKDMVSRSIARFRIYLLRIRFALRLRTLSLTNDPESGGGSQELVSFREIYLDILDYPADAAGAHSIQWIIEMSTDMDIITTALQMVPNVEWPDGDDVTVVLDQLTSQLYVYVDFPGKLTPHTRERAQAYLKAIFHLYGERGRQGPLDIRNHNLLVNDRHFCSMPNNQDFQLISCVIERPYGLDITSLPFSDRMWMAHTLIYHLHHGDQPPSVLAFVHEFIDKCLRDQKSPSRLVADCLLLAGMMVGLQPNRRHLAKIDKSAAIRDIQGLVIDRILYLLLSEAPVSHRGYTLDAAKYLRLLAYSKHSQYESNYPRSVQCLKLCFCLLEDQGAEGDQTHSTNVMAALRLSYLYTIMTEEYKVWTYLYRTGSGESKYLRGPPEWHTQAQFDMLVDYLVQVGQGTDYIAIGDAFAALAGLRGSPSTLERKHLYIQTMIRFMESDLPLRTRHAAVSAAYALRTEVASMDRDDEPLRYLFSRALNSVMRARDPPMQQHTSTSVHDNPFNVLLDINWPRDRCYLGLLCALSKEPTWHGHLDRHGHFKNCLAIADTLSSQLRTNVASGTLAVHLTYVFAIADTVGEDHEFHKAIQTYPIWPLILRAWRYMFSFPFFADATVENWEELSRLGPIESLPYVAAYAKKHWEQWDNRVEMQQLIQLIEQVCDKLDEEKRQREQSLASVELRQEYDSLGHRGLPKLKEEIWELLDVFWKDILR